MNPTRALIVFSITIAIFGVSLIGSAMLVSASCNGTQIVSPINVYANVRRSPSTTSSIAYKLNNGESREYDTYTEHWYHLTTGGYIHDSVVEQKCIPDPTPTRMVSVTKTVDANGNQEYHYICPSACEITVKLEALP